MSQAGIISESYIANGVGGQITSFVPVGSAVTLVNSTPTNITSISLTAGTWDITGLLGVNGSAGATLSAILVSVSPTSAVNGTLGNNSTATNIDSYAQDCFAIVPQYRVVLAATTTYYLVGECFTGGGSVLGYGRISAVKVKP